MHESYYCITFGCNVIQKVDAVAGQAMLGSSTRRSEVGDPNPIPAEEKHPVIADPADLAPSRRREIHLVHGDLGDLVHVGTVEEDDDQEELAAGLDEGARPEREALGDVDHVDVDQPGVRLGVGWVELHEPN